MLAAIDSVCHPLASDTEVVAALRECGAALDRVDAKTVGLIGSISRRGTFAEHGYRRPEHAVAELLDWDVRPARRRVRVAEQLCSRVAVDGQILPPVLAATGEVFAAGRLGVAQAEVIAAVLDGPAAKRLDPDTWAGAEERIAAYGADTGCTPNELSGWAKQLIDALDQDGPAPDERERTNELYLSRHRSGTGGRIRGDLDGPTFDALATAVGAMSGAKPDSAKSLPERQAAALGEICGYTLRHDETLPESGGERPQIRLTVGFEALRRAVAGATIDTGAWFSPGQLRRLACDAQIVPAVLGTHSEPLDIGRASRTIPAGLRRAVTIRDKGCAYPGCGRAPSFCDVHHIIHWVDGGPTSLENLT